MASGLGAKAGVPDRGFVPSYARAPAQLAIKADKIRSGFPANPSVFTTNPSVFAAIKAGYGSSAKPLPVNPNIGAAIKPNYQLPVPPSSYSVSPGAKPLRVPPILAAKTKPDYPAGAPVPPPPNQPSMTPPNQPSMTPPSPQAQPMHWPHQPGWSGTRIIEAAPVGAPQSTVVVPSAGVTAVTPAPAPAHPLQANSDPCSCLSKQYARDGSVVFMDRCTNEVATTSPQQTGEDAWNRVLRQLPDGK
jgi:hypothetical protein